MRRWLTALRLTRRELARSPRSGILVAALVALPSAAVMIVSVVTSSQVATTAESLRAELGATQAKVWVLDATGLPVVQSPVDPAGGYSMDRDPANGDTPIEYAMPADVQAALPTGVRTIEISEGSAVLEHDGAFARVNAVAGESWDPALNGPYEVLSGRVPRDASEVMVSPGLASALGIQNGDIVTQSGSTREAHGGRHHD